MNLYQQEQRALTEAGFRVVGMGGGCTAWQRGTPDSYMLVTDADGSVPLTLDGEVIVGYYNDEECCDCLVQFHFNNLSDAVDWVAHRRVVVPACARGVEDK